MRLGERVVAVLQLPIPANGFGDLDRWTIVPDFGLEAAARIEGIVAEHLQNDGGLDERTARAELEDLARRLRAGERVIDVEDQA